MAEKKSCCVIMKENSLMMFTLGGVVLGFGFGFGLRSLNPSPDAMIWIGLPGVIYMRMLTCTILPLVVSSIITGTSTLDPKSNGKISMVTMVYIALSNGVGVLFGLAMYFMIKPGDGVDVRTDDVATTSTNLQTQDLFVDLIRNMFPDNIITASFQKEQTVYLPQKAFNKTTDQTQQYIKSRGTSSSMNILGIIVISSAMGMAIAQIGEDAKPLVTVFKGLSEVIIKILRWIVWRNSTLKLGDCQHVTVTQLLLATNSGCKTKQYFITHEGFSNTPFLRRLGTEARVKVLTVRSGHSQTADVLDDVVLVQILPSINSVTIGDYFSDGFVPYIRSFFKQMTSLTLCGHAFLKMSVTIGLNQGKAEKEPRDGYIIPKLARVIEIKFSKYGFTPIGVISLISASVASVKNLVNVMESVGVFVVTVSIPMAILVFLVYPLLYFIFTRNNPVNFTIACVRPLMTGIAPPSTAVAMPDMFNVTETKLGVDVRISRFVIPFGAALNRSGSCCFIVIAAVFLCKLDNADLETPDYLVISVLCWVSGLAIPSVPSSSIISIIIILASVNVQPSNVGLLLALEWLLDRLRTGANVMSVICGTVLANRLCGKDLSKSVNIDTRNDPTLIDDARIKLVSSDGVDSNILSG